jgi:dihydrofolate reductase
MSNAPSPTPDVVAIAAVARNGVIGAHADIPWRIPEDWRRFKRLTTGQVLIMGRKTFDSIGRPLPGRTTLVITRNPRWRHDGVQVSSSVPAALAAAATLAPETIFVAGGGQIYRAAWESVSRLEITEVDAAPEGDVRFPEIRADDWQETDRIPGPGYAFVTYRRRPNNEP